MCQPGGVPVPCSVLWAPDGNQCTRGAPAQRPLLPQLQLWGAEGCRRRDHGASGTLQAQTQAHTFLERLLPRPSKREKKGGVLVPG